MKLETVIKRLQSGMPELREHGIGHVYVFGSTVMGKAKRGSDVDVFVDPLPNRLKTLREFMAARDRLSKIVGGNVDFGTRKGLHPVIRPSVEREAVKAF